MKKIRVLVVDDTKEVLNKVNYLKPIVVDGETIKIQVMTVHVKFKDGTGKIADETLIELGRYSKKPFDYIFSDFAFIFNKDGNDELRKLLVRHNDAVERGDSDEVKAVVENRFRFVEELLKEENKSSYKEHLETPDLIEVTPLELKKVGKTLLDIKSSLPISSPNDHTQCVNSATRNLIENNFFNHQGKLYIYTNSPKPFSSYFEGHSLRGIVDAFSDAFPNTAELELDNVIKMHEEFGIRLEMIESITSPETSEFKSVLIATKLRSLLEEAGLKRLVLDRRYLRIKKTLLSQLIVSALIIFVGVLAWFFGVVISEKLPKFTDSPAGLVTVVALVLGLTVISTGALYLLEKYFKNYLETDHDTK